jgi:hypothetical protein
MNANSGMKRAEKPNGRRDEGGPLVAAVQAEASRQPLGFCEDSPLRDASSDSPAGSKGRRPSKSKLFPPAGAGVGGGENTVQALLWNVGTCPPDAKGAMPVGSPQVGAVAKKSKKRARSNFFCKNPIKIYKRSVLWPIWRKI